MKETMLRPLIFGEVLFDYFPDGSKVLGGAPFNAAWHLQAFGHKPLLISRVGDDALGKQIQDAMQAWGMDTTGLQIDTAHATGKVEVSFSEGEPDYDIVFPSAYDFIEIQSLPELTDNFLIYHGSLALRDKISSTALEAVCRRTKAPVFVDVNLRQPWWDIGRIRQMLINAHWIKLNSDEFKLIGPSNTPHDGGFIALTRGGQGASLISAKTTETIVPQQASTFVDTVGAGDAFCSVLLTGIIRNWPLDIMIRRAQDFASAVVGIRGATSTDPNFYQRFIDAWQD